MKTISIFAGNQLPRKKSDLNLAYETGFLLAKNKFIVASGGGEGMMDLVLKGAKEANGKTIGVCLKRPNRKQSINAQKIFLFKNIENRQKKLISLGEAYIALPGGVGTIHEICDILIQKKIDKIPRHTPLIIVGSYYKNFKKLIEQIDQNNFSSKSLKKLCTFVSTPSEIIKIIKK